MIIIRIKKYCIFETFSKVKTESISKFILSLLSFSISSRNRREFFYTGSFCGNYNITRLVIMSKRQVIKSFSIINYDNNKKTFAIQL